ncbi:MAG: hypothetical protein LUH47_06685 [Clostridiales bacterium]|nr:hypothetical protein [Clostridiales bacterium]
MAIQLVEKFLPYVDELFTTESKKDLLTNNDFNWSGAHTVKVYKVSTASMYDYNRSGENTGSRYGTVQTLNATTEEFMLKKDRSFTFEIDKLDSDETQAQLEAGQALARQLREVIIPEVDTYVYSVMCENAGIKPEPKNVLYEGLYYDIAAANAALDDAEVPETGRIIVVTPETYMMMKACDQITMETEIGNDMRIKGVIANLDGCSVVKVPANRLPAEFSFMVCHPCATVAPTKLEDYTTHENPPGISGSLVEGRICYDAFVLENKANAIFYQRELERMPNDSDSDTTDGDTETETETE